MKMNIRRFASFVLALVLVISCTVSMAVPAFCGVPLRNDQQQRESIWPMEQDGRHHRQIRKRIRLLGRLEKDNSNNSEHRKAAIAMGIMAPSV